MPELHKCSFGVRTAPTTGHVVDNEELKPSNKLTESICKLAEPASKDELIRSFDLVSFFAAFLSYFADITKPLYEALKIAEFKIVM